MQLLFGLILYLVFHFLSHGIWLCLFCVGCKARKVRKYNRKFLLKKIIYSLICKFRLVVMNVKITVEGGGEIFWINIYTAGSIDVHSKRKDENIINSYNPKNLNFKGIIWLVGFVSSENALFSQCPGYCLVSLTLFDRRALLNCYFFEIFKWRLM